MKFIMEQKEILHKDKTRPPEISEEITVERSGQNETADTSDTQHTA